MVGKPIWIEMDVDRSATVFRPRKARIVHSFGKPPLKEAVVAELDPPTWVVLPVPRKVRYVVLQYSKDDNESISGTFAEGHSYAEVLALRQPRVLGKETFGGRDVFRLGFASVFPWPKPNSREIKRLLSERSPR